MWPLLAALAAGGLFLATRGGGAAPAVVKSVLFDADGGRYYVINADGSASLAGPQTTADIRSNPEKYAVQTASADTIMNLNPAMSLP